MHFGKSVDDVTFPIELTLQLSTETDKTLCNIYCFIYDSIGIISAFL